MAILPIGAYEPRWFMKGSHCSPEEAVQILDLKAKNLLSMHWGAIRLSTEILFYMIFGNLLKNLKPQA